MGRPPDRTDPVNPFDPFGFWKQSQQAMLEAWSKTMTDAVDTEQYAEATGRMLDSYLAIAAPLRKAVEQTMAQLLNQLSLPSRAEVVSLAERLTNIELRLDDLDARLDDIHRGVERTISAVAALRPLAATPEGGDADTAGANGRTARSRATGGTRGSRAGGAATTRPLRAAQPATGTATARRGVKAK